MWSDSFVFSHLSDALNSHVRNQAGRQIYPIRHCVWAGAVVLDRFVTGCVNFILQIALFFVTSIDRGAAERFCVACRLH